LVRKKLDKFAAELLRGLDYDHNFESFSSDVLSLFSFVEEIHTPKLTFASLTI
jgi:hypothetical protein